MNLALVKNTVTSKFARQVLLTKKNSPAIMFVGGVVGVTATVVLACRATLKAEVVLEQAEHKQALAVKRREHAAIRTQTAFELAKLYAPAVIVGGLSIGALTGSHITLQRRNTALMAAYSTLYTGFQEYRQRVIGEYGEEKDLEYRNGIQHHDIHDTQRGEVVRVSRRTGYSPYAKLFSEETSKNWQQNPEYNYLFLRAQQNYANDRLEKYGFVILNDVYYDLGLDKTSDGCVVGWVKGHGDGYVDFGIFNGENLDDVIDFARDKHGALWLDFNVDGLVYNLI